MTVMRWLSKSLHLITNPKTTPPFHKIITKKHLHSSTISNNFVGNVQSSINSALIFSADSKSVVIGTGVHGKVIKLGYTRDIFSQNNLINLYMKCACFSDGLKVFDEMPDRNLVSWTLIISGAVENGECRMGLEAFLEMRRNGFVPNQFALGSVLKVCSTHTSGGGGRNYDFLGFGIHCFALKNGIEKNPFVGSSILHMYSKFGDAEAAEKVFESVENCGDMGCWNAMIGGYSQCGLGFEAVKTFRLMHFRGIKLDEFTFINSLNGCSILGDLAFGEQIHGLVVRSGMDQSTSVMNSLMDMCFKSGGKVFALRLFDDMVEKDVVSWNTVFGGVSQGGDVKEVAKLFHHFMFSRLKPNHITFSVLFRSCGEVHDLHLGLQIYCLAFQFGFTAESNVASSIINMFSGCGETGLARLVFDSMAFKNTSILNEMILGYNLTHDIEALRLFCSVWAVGLGTDDYTVAITVEACFSTGILETGRQIHGLIVKSGLTSHGHVYSSLIRGYVKFGRVLDSFHFFNGLDQLDLACCSTMISALVHQSCNHEAMEFLKYMIKEGEKPDDFILSSILNGCASLASHSYAKSVYSLIIKMGFERYVSVASAAIDAYSKSGDLESAKMTFSQSSEFADVILFNSMIMAYAHHGLVLEAMKIFEKMKMASLKPSQATFVSVISACSHVGLVYLGRTLFESISSDYGMNPSPDNYGCLVDLLSRCGLLEDAKCVIEAMPFLPWPAILRSLLNGCRVHGDNILGEWAARNLNKLVPNDNASYVLMSRIHSEDGHWEDAAKVRGRMSDEGVLKDLACSWIEI